MFTQVGATAAKADTCLSARAIRRVILDQSKRAHVGHIGSALSVADILAALYGQILRIPSPENPDRDRFVLSKGHAALALYAVLSLRRWIADDDLASFCGDGTLLGVHPERAARGVDFSTGSLGQGLSMAVGAALAARIQKSARRVFVLLSDAECNEGSVWEAITFAAHHHLANLTAIVDLNGQQALGYTNEVLAMSSMAERWRAFGWEARDVDGHDVGALCQILADRDPHDERPRVLIARTIFGKGVSFMEGQIKWHYLPLSDEQYVQALDEIGVAL
jgi:transketolase